MWAERRFDSFTLHHIFNVDISYKVTDNNTMKSDKTTLARIIRDIREVDGNLSVKILVSKVQKVILERNLPVSVDYRKVYRAVREDNKKKNSSVIPFELWYHFNSIMKKQTNRRNNTTARSNTTKTTTARQKTTAGIPKGCIVRSLREILGEATPTRSKIETLTLARLGLNPSSYEVMDTVGRTKNILLRPRFHNVRNKQGQFTEAKA